MLNLKYSAAAAALALTGITGFSALAAQQQQQKEPDQKIFVSQDVCDAFEQAVKAVVVRQDPNSKLSRNVLISSVQAQIRAPIEELVLQDNPALNRTFTDAVKQSAKLDDEITFAKRGSKEEQNLLLQDAVLTEQVINTRYRVDLAIQQACPIAWNAYLKLGR